MELDLSSLAKAIDSLERTLKVAHKSRNSSLDDDTKETVRAGVIQNFEFTYELCWKFMRRWLQINLGREYAEGVTRRELFRLSTENQLIDDIDRWMEYHDARNETVHTYDNETAEEVFAAAQDFITDAKALLNALEARNA